MTGWYKEQEQLYEILKEAWNDIYNRQDLVKCLYLLKDFNIDIYNHSIVVGALSLQIGAQMGIKPLNNLFTAALFHDYGKVLIPKTIHDKPGKLNSRELLIIQMHSVIGYVVLKQNTTLPEDILIGILDHHERIDGSGYPDKKANDFISVYGKIIAIADVYSAMVSKRVYHDPVPAGEAKRFIKYNAGALFDNGIVHAFLEIIDSFELEQKKILRFEQQTWIKKYSEELKTGEEDLKKNVI